MNYKDKIKAAYAKAAEEAANTDKEAKQPRKETRGGQYDNNPHRQASGRYRGLWG